MHAPLLSLIQDHVTLTAPEQQLCMRLFEPVVVSRHQVLEEEGDVPRYLYFIVEGYLRLFYFDEKGNEVTTHINCPPGFITAYTHFIQGSTSDVNLESITDCTLLRINKAGIDELMQTNAALKDFSIWVFQASMRYNEERAHQFSVLSAEERYALLLHKQPDLLLNVPLQMIASYLGMNAKSLSRIRKNTR